MIFEEIETPAPLVDLERVRANLERVSRYCSAHGLTWRPHVKTHKSPELAAEQRRMGAVGVTVATPREAETMVCAVDDVLLAYPPVGTSKLRRLMELAPFPTRLAVALDSSVVLRGLDRSAHESGREVDVLVELDVGMGRLGVQSPADAVALAREAAGLNHVRYRGLLFYPGHIREPLPEQGSALRRLSETLARFLGALAEAGLPPETVSGGSTPTLWRSHEIGGITEVRPGTNIFNDRTTAAIGACAWDECAYSVLSTVVSTSVSGQAVIDAGSKALSREELRGPGGGYGALLDRPEVTVRTLSEEHGMLELSGTRWRPRVGERVRVVPNHVCVSVNLSERLFGVEGGGLIRSWPVAGRGRERAEATLPPSPPAARS